MILIEAVLVVVVVVVGVVVVVVVPWVVVVEGAATGMGLSRISTFVDNPGTAFLGRA